MNNSPKDRIVLAFSGGVRSSAAISWLKSNFDAEIVTVTLDVGQGTDLTAVRERALELGALRAHVIEARDELVRDFILPSLRAGALFDGGFPLSQALVDGLLAKRLVDLARMEGAAAVAHASSRLDVAIHALAPSLRVIAVAQGTPQAWTGTTAVDVNLWGRTFAFDRDVDPESYTLTRTANDCPDEPAFIEIEFEEGVPVRANGIEMPMLELIESLEIIAGAHGVGRVEAKSPGGPRMVAEAPAATVLHAAFRHLEDTVLPAEFSRVKHDIGRTYADLIFQGCWHSPAREALDAYIRGFQGCLNGRIRVELFKGACRVVDAGDFPRTSFDRDADTRPAVEA